MHDAEPRSMWKRVLMVAVKVYAGLCTALVTAALALILWEVWTRPTLSQERHGQPTTAEAGPRGLDFSGIGLSYDLPKAASASGGRSPPN